MLCVHSDRTGCFGYSETSSNSLFTIGVVACVALLIYGLITHNYMPLKWSAVVTVSILGAAVIIRIAAMLFDKA